MQKSCLKEYFGVICILLAVLFVFYPEFFLGTAITGWDTHYVLFQSFLFFRDALANGHLPFWNPLIQSGVFFPSFINAGLYAPFQLLFTTLAFLINPAHAYGLLIQTTMLIGGLGAYFFFRTIKIDRPVAIFGAITYMLALLVPIVGEFLIVSSLSMLAWLLVAVHWFIKKPIYNFWWPAFFGMFAGFFASYGYPWFNMVNVGIALVYAIIIYVNTKYLEKSKAFVLPLIVFMASFFIIYSLLIIPGFVDLQTNYHNLSNYKNIDPALRSFSLTTSQIHSFQHHFFRFIVSIIDFRIVGTADFRINDVAISSWNYGAGWLVWVIFFFTFLLKRKKININEYFWIAIGALASIYALKPGGLVFTIIRHTPLLNANRWMFNGNFYVIAALIFLIIPRLNIFLNDAHAKYSYNRNKIISYSVKLLIIYGSILTLLIWWHSAFSQYAVIIASSLMMFFVAKLTKNRYCKLGFITLLILISVVSFYTASHSSLLPKSYMHGQGSKKHLQAVKTRNKSTNIRKNFRRLGHQKMYISNDQQWILKKIPFSHGLNPLSSPLYWWVKDESFITKILDVKQSVRKAAFINRKNFPNSNAYANSIVNDIKKDPSRPTIPSTAFRKITPQKNFHYTIEDFLQTPNTLSAKITTSGPAYVIFYNNNSPGWKVILDHHKMAPIRIDHIFMGAYINNPGKHQIIFVFRPILTYVCLTLAYALLLICVIMLIVKSKRAK